MPHRPPLTDEEFLHDLMDNIVKIARALEGIDSSLGELIEQQRRRDLIQ